MEARTQEQRAEKKKLKVLGRKKRVKRLGEDKEFAKAVFERKSKNSEARKVAYKKRRSGKAK